MRIRSFIAPTCLFLLLGTGLAHGADLAVHADVPPPPLGSLATAVQFQVPGFDPALGTLTGMDLCVNLDYSSTQHLSTSYWQPFTIGAPVSYSMELGMRAGFGYFDAAGFTTLGAAAHRQLFSGTLNSFVETRRVTAAGTATGCGAITNPIHLGSFVSAGPTNWYMQMGSYGCCSVSSPPYPTASVGSGMDSVELWQASVDVTYHYTPTAVAAEVVSLGAVKSIFR